MTEEYTRIHALSLLPCGHLNITGNLQPRKSKRSYGYKTTMVCRMCRKIQNHKHYMNKKKKLAKEMKHG